MGIPSDFSWPLSDKQTKRLIRYSLLPVEYLLTLAGGVITFATIILFAIRNKVRLFRLDPFKESGSTATKKVVLRTDHQQQSTGDSGGAPPVEIKGKGNPEVTQVAQIASDSGDKPESARRPVVFRYRPLASAKVEYSQPPVSLEDQPERTDTSCEEVLEVKLREQACQKRLSSAELKSSDDTATIEHTKDELSKSIE